MYPQLDPIVPVHDVDSSPFGIIISEHRLTKIKAKTIKNKHFIIHGTKNKDDEFTKTYDYDLG